jgi:murein hydrolase activator
MTTGAAKRAREKQPASIGGLCFRVGLMTVLLLAATGAPAQTPENPGQTPPETAGQVPAQADPAANLALKRDSTRSELEALSKTITLSNDRAAQLQAGIAELEKTSESLRTALVASADKRKALEQQIIDGEDKLNTLRTKEDAVHASLRARRGVLAEVLAALQRMGRNPPPALLVTPEDALGSVRSAILLGAVVPGIRHETENLAADLKALAGVRKEIVTQKQALGDDMTARLEEERRMNMLIVEKQKLKQRSATELASERRKAEQLAAQATSLEGLIGSIESEITSARDAAAAARAEEESRRLMSEAQRNEARALANSTTPDKNRIAPAYAFSDLQKKTRTSGCRICPAHVRRRRRHRAFPSGHDA